MKNWVCAKGFCCEGLLLIGLVDNDEKVASSEKTKKTKTCSRVCKNQTLVLSMKKKKVASSKNLPKNAQKPVQKLDAVDDQNDYNRYPIYGQNG